jgi:hypothetical protein
MLGHLELLPNPAASEFDSIFSRFPRLGSETPTSAGTDIGDSVYSILSFIPRHAQWVGTFGNRVQPSRQRCVLVRLVRSLIPAQVDLNLFKVQREEADPISSIDTNVVHTLNTDVRNMTCRLLFLLSLRFVFRTHSQH